MTMKKNRPQWLALLLCALSLGVSTILATELGDYAQVKIAGFNDPNTGYKYRVASYNLTTMTTNNNHRSVIKVARVKLNDNSIPTSAPEDIQTINFHPTLVDFDLQCLPSHCYLVAVTSRTRRNVELYSWQRTQFDLLAKRDSFARPNAVKLLRIHSAFYVAVAQEQLHLSTLRLTQEYEEPTRFIGCAILKFTKGHEKSVKYHQFIKLPFNPHHVNHVIATNPNNITLNPAAKPAENNYLVFSFDADWKEPSSRQVMWFTWSPLNEYFWPYKMPRGAVITSKSGFQRPIVKFPSQLKPANFTLMPPQDQIESVESCFTQLQRLLTDREVHARKLIDNSRTLWHSSTEKPLVGLTNISAQVIVHGNVIVKGSLIESPQITLIGQKQPEIRTIGEISHLVDSHSPAIVENKLMQAVYKLKYIRDKLARAIPVNLPPESQSFFNSRVRFFGNIKANNLIISGNGISNSDVRLNGIQFKQLEHDLVSLRGVQEIPAKVIFRGNVIADLLEIHGLVNQAYYIKDAIDITSKRVQVIDYVSPNLGGSVAFDFVSVDASELVLSPNNTFNRIQLSDFILKDDRAQFVYGRKSFKHLSMGQLTIAHPNVPLNGFNLSRLALNSIRLQDPSTKFQIINGNYQTFSKPVTVNKLIINNSINRHINISSLIHDSIKTNDIVQQQISGHKNFLEGLKIAHLTTEGLINGIQLNQVFNLNPTPPIQDYTRYLNNSPLMTQVPITGKFIFNSTVIVDGNLNANLVNGNDLFKQAIRRVPFSNSSSSLYPNISTAQIVHGKKIFLRPLRIVNRIRLMDQKELTAHQSTYPLINGFDIRLINDGLTRQIRNPSVIYIDHLDIEGNLDLRTSFNLSGQSLTTFGNYSICPLDALRSRIVLGGAEDQVVEVPTRIYSLRSKSILLEPGALNGMSFPQDFVLKSGNGPYHPVAQDNQVEFVFGHKTFDHLSVVPSLSMRPLDQANNYAYISSINGPPKLDGYYSNVPQSIHFGSRSSINNITYNELQTFIAHERRRNSTGETVFQTLTVHGNIIAKRINGHYWPDDILLRSIVSNLVPTPSPYFHKRIYSPLIFLNSSNFVINNQLVLRGPVQLEGTLNGINLTEFSRNSATYGDKDLLSIGRPIRNKVFLGGLTVTSEMRSQGYIDGVNIDEMKERVVTIGPKGKKVQISSPKVFMSDVNFLAPTTMLYLNDMPIDHYLRRIRFQQDGELIQILGNKTITGVLKINKHLIVQGLINGIDFVDLKARAISLSPENDEIHFNKTLIIEGDAFMDNLMIDERNGTIDGVKLINLLPINPVDPVAKNEIIISGPILTRQNVTHGPEIHLIGGLNDCKITCQLSRVLYNNQPALAPSYPHQPQAFQRPPSPQPTVTPPLHPGFYPPRPVYHNGGNVTYMRTTPPYAMQTTYQVPQVQQFTTIVHPDQARVIHSLSLRRPASIQYERLAMRRYVVPEIGPMVRQQLDALSQQIVSLNLFGLSSSNDLVVGFIQAASDDVGQLRLPENIDEPHFGHIMSPRPFLQLDQIDFPFGPTTYHLSVGMSTSGHGANVTSVLYSLGGGETRQLSVLPIESPNSAMFLRVSDLHQTLFLLISQDHTIFSNKYNSSQCPRYTNMPAAAHSPFIDGQVKGDQGMSGVHVYLFHSLQNSSSLGSAYFDLYQTIDLPVIDSFENFNYHGSTYAVAVSRVANKVFLLLLRGYSGFQVVSYIDAPLIEYVRILYNEDQKPLLLVYLTDGLHRLMEAVII